MNMTGRRYIAYGSNLNRGQMALRCPDAKVVGTGEIKDYELLFRGNRNGAVATVEPKKGESVPVLIWEISPRDEFNLDRYEGYPRLYGKEMLEVEMDGKRGENDGIYHDGWVCHGSPFGTLPCYHPHRISGGRI